MMARVLGEMHLIVFDDGKCPMRVEGDLDEAQVLNVLASQCYAIVKTFGKYGAPREEVRRVMEHFIDIVKFGKAQAAKIKKDDHTIWMPDVIGGPFGNN